MKKIVILVFLASLVVSSPEAFAADESASPPSLEDITTQASAMLQLVGKQRDAALNENVGLSGQVALLKAQLEKAQKACVPGKTEAKPAETIAPAKK